MAGSLKDTNESELLDAWDELLKPVEPLGKNEITLQMAMEKLGVQDDKSAKKKMRELEKTGEIEFVGEARKQPNGRVALYVWRLKT